MLDHVATRERQALEQAIAEDRRREQQQRDGERGRREIEFHRQPVEHVGEAREQGQRCRQREQHRSAPLVVARETPGGAEIQDRRDADQRVRPGQVGPEDGPAPGEAPRLQRSEAHLAHHQVMAGVREQRRVADERGEQDAPRSGRGARRALGPVHSGRRAAARAAGVVKMPRKMRRSDASRPAWVATEKRQMTPSVQTSSEPSRPSSSQCRAFLLRRRAITAISTAEVPKASAAGRIAGCTPRISAGS